MTNTLRAAGIGNKILGEIPAIIKTCRECRVWATPGAATQTSITLPERFGQHVEGDILFYKKAMVFHLICRASRWRAGRQVLSKAEQELLDALYGLWVGLHGPMENFHIDGESGLNSDRAKAQLKRDGITLRPRAPGQHARFVERYGALLRACMHLCEEQCKREGVTISLEMLIAQALFAGNAMTSVGNATPYQCVYGRQPAMLPPIEPPGDAAGDSADGRKEARVREIAIQSIIQASSLARTRRAASTRTSSSGQGLYEPGDLVDWHRPPASKDESGWRGPAQVVRNVPSDGGVIIKSNGRELPCRYQDVRHTLLVAHTFLTGLFTTPNSAADVVIDFINSLAAGTVKTFGMILDRSGAMKMTAATRQEPRLVAALSFVTRNHLMIDNVVAVRLAHGARRLNHLTQADSSLLYWWPLSSPSNVSIIEHPASDINMLQLVGSEYPNIASMQTFISDDSDHSFERIVNELAATPEGSVNDGDEHGHGQTDDADHLSTIPEEGPEDDTWFVDTLDAYFPDRADVEDEDLRDACLAILKDDSAGSEPAVDIAEIVPAYVSPLHDFLPSTIYEHIHYMQAGISVANYASLDGIDELGNPGVEVYYSEEMSRCLFDMPGLEPGTHVTVLIYAAGPAKAVVQRDDDLLTKEELKQHKAAVEAAILEELRIWHKHGAFKRHKRRAGMNIMTSRFVAKWKFVTDEHGNRRRIIRMPLVLRGFQDWFAYLQENYAGTASRLSQRIVNSEVACHPDWILVTIDIEKAFLQGLTCKELEEVTGESERLTYFVLPPGAAAVLRLIDGYEGYDERYECLLSAKMGTGTKGAPRAFGLKLASITQSAPCNYMAITYEPQLEVKHSNGELVSIMAKHVDDVKIGGTRQTIEPIIACLERTFGKLKYHEKSFTNTGVRHNQLEDGSVETDQDEYLKALQPIVHQDLVGAPADSDAPPSLQALYMSLLGAMAYALLTQFHLAVYVVSLQRQTQKPKIIHIRRLNAVVRAAQRRPARVLYRAMVCLKQLECHSDSGFTKEQDKGYGIRGANFMRIGRDRRSSELVRHLLDSQCRSHKTVTRSTFSSETLAAVGAADELMPMALTLHEVYCGPRSASETRRLREEGALAFETMLTIDAMSLFAAVSASSVRVPTEKNLALHLFWLRELLDKQLLSKLRWTDTRDMTADAHTKGCIPRDALLALMKGVFNVLFPVKDFVPKAVLRKKSHHDPTTGGDDNHPYAHPKRSRQESKAPKSARRKEQNPKGSNRHTQPLSEASKWRQQILGLLRKFEPHNVPRINQIMEAHKGREREFFRERLANYTAPPPSRAGNKTLGPRQCRYCLKHGHLGNECPDNKPKLWCYRCLEHHKPSECPMRIQDSGDESDADSGDQAGSAPAAGLAPATSPCAKDESGSESEQCPVGSAPTSTPGPERTPTPILHGRRKRSHSDEHRDEHRQRCVRRRTETPSSQRDRCPPRQLSASSHLKPRFRAPSPERERAKTDWNRRAGSRARREGYGIRE